MPKYGQYDIPNSDTMVNFGTGQPNNLNLPMEWFQATCFKMATDMFGSDESEHKQLLQYGAISGYPDIREKMAEWLTEKYYSKLHLSLSQTKIIPINPNQIFMTNGNTGALEMLINKYTKPNDFIIVENPTYFIAINIFKEHGLNVIGVNMESDGINLSTLEYEIIKLNKNHSQSRLFYYTIPAHHNPTGITTSHKKRQILAQLCDKHENLYVIADEVYHLLTFNETLNFLPMADYHNKMLSLGSFSKILAPALRVGWIYEREHNFIDKLSNSAVLDSSGGINPIGFKFIEYVLDKQSNGIRNIDEIIDKTNKKLEANCLIMTEFLGQVTDVSFVKPNGGYFLWLKFDTVLNTADFLKTCEKNKVKFHPGVKFATDSSFNNCIRLSFSYYNPVDIVIGLERLINLIPKSSCEFVNIKIHGATGKLGSLIKKAVINSNDLNYIGDIQRTYNLTDFVKYKSSNLVIIDVSSTEGTFNLLTFLTCNSLYFPLIIGTTGIKDNTTRLLIEKYSKLCPVAHITNFSEGVPLFRQFARISNSLTSGWNFSMTDIHHVHKKDAPSGTAITICNEITRDTPIASIRTGEVIGEHTLELTNGSESIKITHNVNSRDTFAKGCLNYIYWILTQSNGLYDKLEHGLNIQVCSWANERIAIGTQCKENSKTIINHIVQYINSTHKNLTKIALTRSIQHGYKIELFSVNGDKIVPINYCGYTLLKIGEYICTNTKTLTTCLSVDNIDYYHFTKNHTNKLEIDLPYPVYIDGNDINNDNVGDIINSMTNLVALGIDEYKVIDSKYLICEINNNIFQSDDLRCACAVINSSQPTNCCVIFINVENTTISLRSFNANNEEVADAIGCAVATDYYMYHFTKSFKEPTVFNFRLLNDVTVIVESERTKLTLCQYLNK
jgi:DNA-binding transcriptional MocR family regulator/dihydrodipicolinate reductase